jgi:hypothetical protein
MRWLKLVLLFVMFFPPLALAQENNSGLKKSAEEPTTQAQVLAQENNSGLKKSAGEATTQPQPQPQPESEAKRPSIEGSMVGYIDNAIVGSQIRFRVDAGFDNHSPDRAEFFYGKCGCYRNPAAGAAFDPNAPGPGPGIPKRLNFQQLYLHAEYAPSPRFSFFTEVPVRFIQPQGFVGNMGGFGNHGGLSDLRAGFKLALVASANQYLTFQFRTYFPTGAASKGLGTDHYSVESTLLLYQKVADRVAVEAHLGDWHPINGSAGVPVANSENFAGDVFTYGVGPSYELYRGETIRFAPVVEFFGWAVLSGFQTDQPGLSKASGTTANIKVGARTSIGNQNSLYLGFGQALSHRIWYDQIVRFEYRYAF